MFELGKAYALYAELLKRKGDLSKARANLNTAAETSENAEPMAG